MIKNYFLTLTASLLIYSVSFGQTIWSEDFESYAENTGIEGIGVSGSVRNIGDYPLGVTKWTLDATNSDLLNEFDWAKTVGGVLSFRDTGLDGVIWQSEPINISGASGSVSFELTASNNSGGFETSDFYNVYYSVDGGSYQLIQNWNGLGDTTHTILGEKGGLDWGTTEIISQGGITGNTLQIRVQATINASAETFFLDNVNVLGVSCSAPTAQATSAVFGVETGTTLNLSSFTAPAGGADGYAIYINNTNTFTTPTDGDEPLADMTWNNAGQQPVYFGTSASPNITVSGLNSGTQYFFRVYAYNDCSGTETYETTGLSASDTTTDTTPPSFENSTPSASSIGETSFTLNTDIDEAGTIYYVVVADGATAPTSAEVKAGTGSGGSGEVTTGNAVVNTGGFTHDFSVIGLTKSTAYDVYVVAEDHEASPNLQASPTKIDVSTITIEGTINWESNTTANVSSIVSTQVSGVTVTVIPQNGGGTLGASVSITDIGGSGAPSGKVLRGTSDENKIVFSFSVPVNIRSIFHYDQDYTVLDGGTGNTLTFTPTGGSNSVVVDGTSGGGSSNGSTAHLNWTGVTSFTVSGVRSSTASLGESFFMT